MFTLKKLALIGAAGLAALSMSCSGDDGDDGSGSFESFNVSIDSDGYVLLSGTIKANDGNTVTSVSATADGNSTTLSPAPSGLNTAQVSLAGVNVLGVCGTVTTSKEFTIKVTATFNDATTTSEEKKVTVDCTTGTTQVPLTKRDITLSYAGKSFGDVDAGQIYSTSEVGTAATAKKIDVIAYATNSLGNIIYSPGADNVSEGGTLPDATSDIFWNLYEAGVYNPGLIVFYDIGATGAAALKNATYYSDIASFIGQMDTITDGPELYEIDITASTGFLVITSEGAVVAVVVTSTGAQLVNLTGISI